MKKSIGDNMIPKGWSFERGLELVKKTGYDGIELWLGEVPWFQMNTTDGAVTELRRKVENAGLVVSNVSTGLHWETPLSTRDPGNWDGWSTDALVRQNKFYVEGKLRFGHSAARSDDGRYTIAPGWSEAKDIVFDGNQYLGEIIDRLDDAKGIVEATAKKPRVNWKEPAFDPAIPEWYSEYIKAHRKWMVQLFQQQFGRKPPEPRAESERMPCSDPDPYRHTQPDRILPYTAVDAANTGVVPCVGPDGNF
jgi:hypothetical protein